MTPGGLTGFPRQILQHDKKKNKKKNGTFAAVFLVFFPSVGQPAMKTSPPSNSCATACPLYITDNGKRQRRSGEVGGGWKASQWSKNVVQQIEKTITVLPSPRALWLAAATAALKHRLLFLKAPTSPSASSSFAQTPLWVTLLRPWKLSGS